MRFLKNKILLARKLRGNPPCEDSDDYEEEEDQVSNNSCLSSTVSTTEGGCSPQDSGIKAKRTTLPYPKTSEKVRCTKNICRNYGRAISRFACSQISQPYLSPILKQKGLDYNDAKEFFRQAYSHIKGIDSFRTLVLPDERDSPKMVACKETFQRICEVFINYFSVNWICHSRLVHKKTHLQSRFKILRRIRSPHLFTYLQSSFVNNRT